MSVHITLSEVLSLTFSELSVAPTDIYDEYILGLVMGGYGGYRPMLSIFRSNGNRRS